MSVVIDCFYRILKDADVPQPYRHPVLLALLRHAFRIAPYREHRNELRKLVPSDVESRVYERMQRVKQTYEVHVLLWRAVYCYVETRDINKAATVTGVTAADIEWVLFMFEATDDLNLVAKSAPAHWSVTPIPEKEVNAIVKHRLIKAMILKKIQFCNSGVIWAFDEAMTQSDLKSDLEYKVLTTVMYYEATRRSRWYLLNSAIQAIGNEINNLTRRATSPESGGVVTEETLARGSRRGSSDKEDGPKKKSVGASVQRIVPIKGVNEDGDEYDIGEAVEDNSFCSMRGVLDTINAMKSQLRPQVYDYLRVVVLREQHDEFDTMIAQLEADTNRELSEHSIMKYARRFFNLTKEDMNIMREVVGG